MDSKTIQSSFQNSVISFSHDVYKEVPVTENGCVSPYSIMSALLLLMAGTGGKSKSQLRTAILKKNWNDDVTYQQYQALTNQVFSSTENEIYIATKLYVKNGVAVTKNVRDVAKKYFNADIEQKDFAMSIKAAEDINSYIALKTKNKITELIKPEWLSSLTVMVLVNAVYFKGVWEKAFNPEETKKMDFYLTESNTIKVDMMYMKHEVRFLKNLHYSVIALPYTGRTFEMVIVLPTNINGLQKLQKSLTTSMVNDIDSKLVNTNVSIYLPKFKFESGTDLKILLPKIGIVDIFDVGNADFSNLINGHKDGIYVSEARHKVVLEVNELGTEAAATTVIVTAFGSGLSPMFFASHPFLFYIRHFSTGSVLFMGHFNPSK